MYWSVPVYFVSHINVWLYKPTERKFFRDLPRHVECLLLGLIAVNMYNKMSVNGLDSSKLDILYYKYVLTRFNAAAS